jgi:hypothetical protein
MTSDWKDLTQLTQGKRIRVERVRFPDSGIALEGSFELPPLAQLSLEDQIFVATFVKTHGSIKAMEQVFGVSYPTIKNRLNRISGALGFGLPIETSDAESPLEILDRLDRGEITVEQAKKALKK